MRGRYFFIAMSLVLAIHARAATVLFPAAEAREICPDTPLRITFDHPPVLGKGKITVVGATDHSIVQTIDVADKTLEQSIGGLPHFNYYPVTIAGNDATICLPNRSLAYNKTYTVTIDAGAFAGMSDAIKWRFSTRSAPPLRGTAKIIVAPDGSGDFCTVQGAIDFVPEGNINRTTIFLRKGVYTEIIYLAKKNAITFTGEDRKQSVIAYSNNARFNPSSEQGYHRGVFLAADCKDLVINNLTIRNTTPRGGSQAEALILNGNSASKAIIANVDLYSFQDTLQINGQAYLNNCRIEGDVDFMWGQGPCFFENCHCYATRSKAFYAQIRNPPAHHGYVYHRCIFDGPDEVTGMYLNRIAPAAYPHSEVVLLDCILGSAVAPVGWQLNASAKGMPVPTTAPDVHFWEYNSHDTDGKPIDVTRRLEVSRQLKSSTDAELIANYSNPAFVLGNHWEAQSDPNLPPVNP